MFVQGTECHLLKVGYTNNEFQSTKILKSNKIVSFNIFDKKVDCALWYYTETDGITSYMKHSLSATHLLPYEEGKFFSQNRKS